MTKSKKSKVIICIMAAAFSVSIAITATILLIKFIKNQNNNPSSVSSSADFVSVTEVVKEKPIVLEPEAPIVIPENPEEPPKDTIDDIIKETETVKPTKENTVIVKHNDIDTSGLTSRSTKIGLKYLPQNPELPTGCEITSLTAVLQFYGYNISKTEMCDKYLEKTMDKIGNFWEVFVGNPRSNGFGCYATPIVNAANRYLSLHGNKHKAVNVSGAAFEDLLKRVENGQPVIIWSTMYGEEEKNLRKPFATVKWTVDGKDIQWIAPEHCMVLIGYDLDRNAAIMADPQRGIVEYDLLTVKSRYLAIHSQSVVLDELPQIEGVKNGCIYYTTQYVNFSSNSKVTVNGKTQTEAFFIEGNIDKTYEIIATDNKGNSISVTVHTKPIMSILEPLKSINENNVTESNRQLIEEIKAAVLELDTTYSPPDEQKSIKQATEHCDTLLKKLDDINAIIRQVEIDLTNLAADGIDQNDIEAFSEMANTLDTLLAGENLTDEQRITVNTLKEKCTVLIGNTPPVQENFEPNQ